MNKRKQTECSESELDKIARKIRKLNKKLLTMSEASDSESTETSTPVGPAIHDEIAQRWTSVLTKGLPPNVKQELIEKHVQFQNIPSLSPKLNPEVIAAVTERISKRDSIIASKQQLVGVALVAIGKSLELFPQQGDNMEILKNLNDAAKVLCDIIHTNTYYRRTLISNAVSLEMKEDLTGEPDGYLFGSDLAEKIEITQAIHNPIKQVQPTHVAIKNNKTKLFTWGAPPVAQPNIVGRPNQPWKKNNGQQNQNQNQYKGKQNQWYQNKAKQNQNQNKGKQNNNPNQNKWKQNNNPNQNKWKQNNNPNQNRWKQYNNPNQNQNQNQNRWRQNKNQNQFQNNQNQFQNNQNDNTYWC